MAFSANIERLQPSATIAVSSLAKQLRREGRPVIGLSAGEPDFDTPGWVAEAATAGIRQGMTRYTPAAGMPELRQAIAGSLSQRAGRDIDPDGVVVTAGAKQALFNACFCLFGPGDEVLVAAPYWTSHPEIVTLARAEPVPVRGAEEDGFKLTPAVLDRAASGRTRGLIYSSPSNPSGAVYSREELTALAEWARDRDVWLIADEIYRYIHFGDGPAPGLLELDPAALGPHVLVDGASKAFAMTGWRIGYSYSEVEVARKMTALQSHVSSNAATPSQVAALAAFRNPDHIEIDIGNMLDAFRRRRDLVVDLFEELLPDFPYVEPQGAFYLFFRVDAAFDGDVADAAAFCTRLLEETGVAVVPGNAFGDGRWVRLSYAVSDAVLEDGIRRMAGMLAKR
ncbi:MAG: pyridoxal phosphate-dependent aminotransferase [Gemmatimonadetes bacterium]|nr:pyridoxal phosphate-dependent aminotransferase [Gemmatimonadota bacterium]